MANIQPVTSIRQLAANLIASKDAEQLGATVILGAGASISSGIPSWPTLAQSVCDRFHVSTAGEDPIVALVRYFNGSNIPYSQRYILLQEHLSGRSPSIGYSHLAQLVKDRLITTILTTNWDPLAEKALLRALPFEDIKVVIRGESPDDSIADLLDWRHNVATLVKLHGDLLAKNFMLGDSETRRFSDKLTKKLEERVSRCTFIVGQSVQDVNLLSVLLNSRRQDGSLYHVRYHDTPSEINQLLERVQATVIAGQHQSVASDAQSVNLGDFDGFFTQLDLAVQQQLTKRRRDHLRLVETSILEKEKTGVGYINYTRITELVRDFTYTVKRAKPDAIVFVDDPAAPGGMEIRRRMLPIMRAEGINVPVYRLQIQGQSGTRTHKRQVTSKREDLPLADAQKVLILDSITFSGNTLQIAREKLKEWFPDLDIRLGVLVISQQLHEKHEALAKANPSESYLSQVVTDRYEIFFPWGVTQTTAAFDRRFEGASKGEERHVSIAKRPWGTIEVLVEQEITSVRLLTIEATRRLSFQRHLCRDELFVALDDNIGLDICAEELPVNADQYDENVKSLILEKGDYVLIPRGVWHRTKASMDRVRLLEIGFGLYDQNYDIERRWDDYERARLDGSV